MDVETDRWLGSPALPGGADDRLVATADFDADGRRDLLLRRGDGRWLVALMAGGTVRASGELPMKRDPAFQVVTASDLTGDGRADVVLHAPDGRWWVYAVDGAAVTGGGLAWVPLGAAWQPLGR